LILFFGETPRIGDRGFGYYMSYES
jgi:hypothetical protein